MTEYEMRATLQKNYDFSIIKGDRMSIGVLKDKLTGEALGKFTGNGWREVVTQASAFVGRIPQEVVEPPEPEIPLEDEVSLPHEGANLEEIPTEPEEEVEPEQPELVVSPAAKKFAKAMGVNLSDVASTSTKITLRDVKRHLKDQG